MYIVHFGGCRSKNNALRGQEGCGLNFKVYELRDYNNNMYLRNS